MAITIGSGILSKMTRPCPLTAIVSVWNVSDAPSAFCARPKHTLSAANVSMIRCFIFYGSFMAVDGLFAETVALIEINSCLYSG